MAKEAGQGLLGIVSAYARGDVGGVASTAMNFFKKATTGDAKYERNKQTKTSPADVIMWSGSKDTQTSFVTLFILIITCNLGGILTLLHVTDKMPLLRDRLPVPCHGHSSRL